jgi:7,8-dihydropterin-6-yl-methyl-4-(beta-D-ribofuranosyl)aminobenzene 5'-phosphate synthase
MDGNMKITVLVENTAKGRNVYGEHGLAYLIEAGGKKILFDAGQTDLVVKNALAMGIDLSNLDSIILSHGHYDHTGGLSAVLDQLAGEVEIYLHPAAIGPKYKLTPDRESVDIGMSDKAIESIKTARHISSCNWVERPTTVAEVLTVTGQVPRNTDFEDTGGAFYIDADCKEKDIMADDQSLFFDSSEGVVVVLGCCHSGIVNTLDYIAELAGSDKIYAVIGGMHLLRAKEARLEKTMKAFKKYDVQMIGPAHCTGMKAVARFWNAFPGKCVECRVGSKFEFELKIRS